MIPETGTKREIKTWMVGNVWADRCWAGHVLIPTAEELTWYHHIDNKGMSIGRNEFSPLQCSHCRVLVDWRITNENVRLTKEYCELLLWGPNGARE